MSARVWPRRAAAALPAVGVVAALVLPAPEQTEAAWTDPEYAGGTFTAITVPAPEGGATPQCKAAYVIVLGSKLTVRWKVPSGAPAYTSANVQYAKAVDGLLDPVTGPLLSSIDTTGTPSAYTTVVSGGLLSGLLGNKITFGIRFVDPTSGWTSKWLVTDATFPTILGENDCSLYVK